MRLFFHQTSVELKENSNGFGLFWVTFVRISLSGRVRFEKSGDSNAFFALQSNQYIASFAYPLDTISCRQRPTHEAQAA
jgi:hypothetical protein